jgi:hypothetical protein
MKHGSYVLRNRILEVIMEDNTAGKEKKKCIERKKVNIVWSTLLLAGLYILGSNNTHFIYHFVFYLD